MFVGKTVALRNSVTGERFEMVFGKDGAGPSRPSPGSRSPSIRWANRMLTSGTGPARYEIASGRVSTSIGELTFDLAVFKSGNKYVAARAGEFGYANYELAEGKTLTRRPSSRGLASETHDGVRRRHWCHGAREPVAGCRPSDRLFAAEAMAAGAAVHFLLIGLTLFVTNSVITPKAPPASSNRIELTTDDLNQLQMSWAAQWQRPPTPGEMSGLIGDRVRQEILFARALRSGLDQGDEIIKRRVAQKMEFLAEDVSAVNAPTPATYRSWFNRNSRVSLRPASSRFTIYISRPTRAVRRQRTMRHERWNSSRRIPRPPLWQVTDSCSRTTTLIRRRSRSLELRLAVRRIDFRTKSGAWHGPVESGPAASGRNRGTDTGSGADARGSECRAAPVEWLSDQRATKRQRSN